MRECRQLAEEDSIEIYAMKQAGKEQNKIAVKLGVYPSTISRELARNTGLRGYRPKQAYQKTLHRRFTARKAVIGKNHQGVLVTLIDRKSKLTSVCTQRK